MKKKTRWFGVSALGAAAMIVTLSGTAGSAMAQPANNACGNAIPVTVGTYNGTTVGATNDGSASCGSSGSAPDVWYVYTATQAASLRVETCTAASYDTVLSLHSGCPGTTGNQLTCNDDACSLRSLVITDVTAGQVVYIRVSGFSGGTGTFTLSVSLQEPPPPGSGPDVTYSNINGIAQYGPVGGTVAYALGTDTCNIGNENLSWTNGGTPGVGFNLYRLHDGRIEQLGQSWAKIACCAAAGNGCGLGCNGQGGSVLGAGCLDVYGASYNGGHGGLRPRSMINSWTGQFLGTIAGPTGTLDRRLQVATADLSPVTYPGALYFAEGVYVADDEPQVAGPSGNHPKMNNASHRRVTFSGNTMSLAANSPMRPTVPAIYAWQEHGLGANTPDTSVVIQNADVPEEGRFIVGHKVTDNGDGTWTYNYAVFNLNSHRAGGSFSIPVASGATVTEVGFRDVNYHSGEPYDNTDWGVAVTPGAVTWTSPQTHAQNPNSNALRWGTMYNFYFTADAAPEQASATLGLFIPGTPATIGMTLGTPTGAVGGGCEADWNDDTLVNSNDISAYLTAWLDSVQNGNLIADFNGDMAVNSNDISAFLTAWLDAVQNGC